MGRFDYVKYDQKSVDAQECFKGSVVSMESVINNLIESPRAKALALTKLEECYMWIGKAIRDDQIDRNKMTESQEERSNS